MITRSTCYNSQMLTVSDGLSDHHAVVVDVIFSRTLVQSKLIDPNMILTLMPSVLIFLNPTLSEIQRDTFPTCVNNTIMYSRLYLINPPDNHQICITKTTSYVDNLNSDNKKTRRHYIERVWLKSRSHLDWSRYSKHCHYCNTQMAKAKSDYYSNMVSNNAENPR